VRGWWEACLWAITLTEGFCSNQPKNFHHHSSQKDVGRGGRFKHSHRKWKIWRTCDNNVKITLETDWNGSNIFKLLWTKYIKYLGSTVPHTAFAASSFSGSGGGRKSYSLGSGNMWQSDIRQLSNQHRYYVILSDINIHRPRWLERGEHKR
jgi:hypothetical protein